VGLRPQEKAVLREDSNKNGVGVQLNICVNFNRKTQEILKIVGFYSLDDDKPLITGFNDVHGSNAG
jgi:hypothetical protein